MDLSLTLVLIADTLAIIMSLIAIYKSNNAIDSGIDSIEKIMEYIESEKCIEEEQKVTTKITSYEQAVKDILEALPADSAKVMDGPIDNTIVIRIDKRVFMEG